MCILHIPEFTYFPAYPKKTRATDATFRITLKSPYRLPLKYFLGGVVPANLVPLSEKPFVCPHIFAERKCTRLLNEDFFTVCGRACDNEKDSPRPAPATTPCVHRLKPPPAEQGFPACRSPKFVHRKNFGGSPSSLKAKATDAACHLTDERSVSVAHKNHFGGVASANFLIHRRNRLFA